MDKYESTLRHIVTETIEGRLVWRFGSPGRYERILVNADRVVRCFVTELQLGEKAFPLLLVERKVWRHDEYEEPRESLELELFVLDGAYNIVLPLYDGVVDRNDLATLAATISDASVEAREFFQALGNA